MERMPVLSLFPLALICSAWRFQQKLDPPLSHGRLILFRCGLLVSVLCSLGGVLAWVQPFPLISDGRGGYSDVRNWTLSIGTLYAAVSTIGLALFGRGAARLLLAGSGLLLATGAYAAILARGH